mmetsp:Transcript_58445/g.92592  ORF Transcript_58445/g.92592 Transcript_58445/m.92592 type:complete len:314 (+) Transcript_58445:28-969(+)
MREAFKDQGFSEADLERACNPGSYLKAVALVKQGAVKITGGAGGAEAQVQSERGTGHYTVRLGRCGVSVNAKCSCVDSRTRPGLCKHAAALALVFLQNGHELPQLLLAPSHTSRAPRPPAMPRKREPSPGLEAEEVEEALPALKKPCFPKPKAAPGPSAVGSSWARGFLLRRLNASALAGDSATFSNDIQRLENLSEKEASTLLHKAIVGNDAVGAGEIVTTLLERPEGRAVAVTGTFDELRRTPLHAAVAADRLGICGALLEARADVAMANGNGLTSLDLAKRRKVDTSKGDWRQREDQLLILLQEAMDRRT